MRPEVVASLSDDAAQLLADNPELFGTRERGPAPGAVADTITALYGEGWMYGERSAADADASPYSMFREIQYNDGPQTTEQLLRRIFPWLPRERAYPGDAMRPGEPLPAPEVGEAPPSGLVLNNALKFYDPAQAVLPGGIPAGHVGTAWVTSTGEVTLANFTGKGDLVSNIEMGTEGLRVPVDSRGNVTPEGIEIIAERFANFWATVEPREPNSGRVVNVSVFRGRDDGNFERAVNELRSRPHGLGDVHGFISRGEMTYGLVDLNCAHVANLLMAAAGVRPQVLPAFGPASPGFSQNILPNEQFFQESQTQTTFGYRFRQ